MKPFAPVSVAPGRARVPIVAEQEKNAVRDNLQPSVKLEKTLAILIPVYNDWSSFSQLVPKLAEALRDVIKSVSVIAIDDGSNISPALTRADFGELDPIESVELLRLITNVGHQRAIAVGLAYIAERAQYDYVLVMDSDGEDRPEDARRLVSAVETESATSIFVAQRSKRSEGGAFKFWYRLYKAAFRGLSGQSIDFGNFCLMPMPVAKRMAFSPETWNHFAAALTKSRVPLVRIPTSRGNRIAGRSSMNLVSLVSLGMSAMSVYSDVLFVRLLMAGIALSVLAAAGMVTVVVIKFFTDFAIPGWATSAAGLLAIMLIQAVTLSLTAAILALSSRSNYALVPAFDAARYVGSVDVIYRANR